MSKISVRPHRDWLGVVEWYEIDGKDPWCGSDSPDYLYRLIRQNKRRGYLSNGSAEAVLAYRLSQMGFWRRLWWHVTHHRVPGC